MVNGHSFIPDIYIAPLQEIYTETLSVQLRPKRKCLKQRLDSLPPRCCRETYFCGGIYIKVKFVENGLKLEGSFQASSTVHCVDCTLMVGKIVHGNKCQCTIRNYYRKTISEEHIVIVQEPNSVYVGHLTSTVEILKVLSKVYHRFLR